MNIIQTELKQCEEVIERNLRAFLDVGEVLKTIRDKRLYRDEYSTFEEYCRERWDFQRHYANRLIASATTNENLVPIGTISPTNEFQIRPLTKLEPEQQRVAWKKAVETAPGGKITAKHVSEIVNGITQTNGDGGKKTDLHKDPEPEMKGPSNCKGLELAQQAIRLLKSIRDDDPSRDESIGTVQTWIDRNRDRQRGQSHIRNNNPDNQLLTNSMVPT